MRARLTVVGETCPVCGSDAERGQGSRDAVQVRCPRCGPFTITGTALAMLASRLDGNERSRARASYAIRSVTSEEHWLEIDSTSVDKLVGSPLPRVERQIDNFLKWMSYKLDDDHMGIVQLPDVIDHLAGVVGAVDSERIEALMSAMQKEGLIERLSNNRARLTMAAWKRLEQSPAQTPTVDVLTWGGYESAAEAAFPLDEIIEAHCPNCGPHRKADVLRRYIEGPDYGDEHYPGYDETIDDYRILKCRGCEAVYVQRTTFTYDMELVDKDDFDPKTGEYNPQFDPTTTYWPAPSRRKPPVWLVKVNDQALRGLLEEVYEALNADLRSLAAMGIRAVLDRTFEFAGADPGDNFGKKLGALETQGHIGSREKADLLIMTDAGSAAAHRGWKPEPEELDSILEATETLLQRVALQGAAAKKIKERVPPRPKSPKK
jgi:hypothetical protein